MLVIGHAVQNVAEDLPELIPFLGVHVAADVFGFDLKLPLEAGILSAVSVDGEDNRVHIQVNWQLVFLILVAFEV